jgi:mono/diheme cytochrome c family protein
LIRRRAARARLRLKRSAAGVAAVSWVLALGCVEATDPDGQRAARAAVDASAPSTPTPTPALAAADLAVDLAGASAVLTAARLGTLRMRTVEVDDHNAGRRVRSSGVSLADAIAAAHPGARPADDALVVFHCADGYAAQARWGAVARYEPMVAFGALEPLPRHGGGTLDPGPFYVFPTKPTPSYADFPWPYQVLRIEIVDAASRPAPMAPTGARADGQVARGYALFQGHCLACHQMNGQGGAVGPELNVPMNVTEYWRPAALRKLLADPLSVRAGSKMPGFGHLGEPALDDLVAYLRYMKGQKIRPARAASP